LATLFGGRVPTAEFGMIAKEIVCWVLSVFGLENTLEGKVANFNFMLTFTCRSLSYLLYGMKLSFD
jgi:hypothetical protein